MNATAVHDATVGAGPARPVCASRRRSAALSLLVMLDATLGLDVEQWRTRRPTPRPRTKAPARSRHTARARPTSLPV